MTKVLFDHHPAAARPWQSDLRLDTIVRFFYGLLVKRSSVVASDPALSVPKGC